VTGDRILPGLPRSMPAGAERAGDLRAFAGTLGSAAAAILAYARGLVYWNLFDLTPEGRGTDWYPGLSYT
jgi:predicted dithiol-disulfide oxidoreductase (DUF899 family)